MGDANEKLGLQLEQLKATFKHAGILKECASCIGRTPTFSQSARRSQRRMPECVLRTCKRIAQWSSSTVSWTVRWTVLLGWTLQLGSTWRREFKGCSFIL